MPLPVEGRLEDRSPGVVAFVFDQRPVDVTLIDSELDVDPGRPIHGAQFQLTTGDYLDHVAAKKDVGVSYQDKASAGSPNANVFCDKLAGTGGAD